MKFTASGGKIVCSRLDNTSEENGVYRHVVEFDSQVDTVPPHVIARLTAGEVDELETFISDRKRIRANPMEKNMLEALPGLLRESKAVLDSVDRINETMYEDLVASISEMRAALEDVRPAPKGSPTPIRNMRDDEVQKQRLENIRQRL